MANKSPVNIEMINDSSLINKLNAKQLKELALLATNADQMNKIIQAQHMDHEVLTVVLAHSKALIEDLASDSLLKLVKKSINLQELKIIFGGINAKRNRSSITSR